MSGEFYQLDKYNATLSKEQAFKSALKEIALQNIFGILQPKQHLMTIKPEGELVLLPFTDEDVTGKKTTTSFSV
jgi:hypothetical protein